jgi:hypothetical protein
MPMACTGSLRRGCMQGMGRGACAAIADRHGLTSQRCQHGAGQDAGAQVGHGSGAQPQHAQQQPGPIAQGGAGQLRQSSQQAPPLDLALRQAGRRRRRQRWHGRRAGACVRRARCLAVALGGLVCRAPISKMSAHCPLHGTLCTLKFSVSLLRAQSVGRHFEVLYM